MARTGAGQGTPSDQGRWAKAQAGTMTRGRSSGGPGRWEEQVGTRLEAGPAGTPGLPCHLSLAWDTGPSQQGGDRGWTGPPGRKMLREGSSHSPTSGGRPLCQHPGPAATPLAPGQGPRTAAHTWLWGWMKGPRGQAGVQFAWKTDRPTRPPRTLLLPTQSRSPLLRHLGQPPSRPPWESEAIKGHDRWQVSSPGPAPWARSVRINCWPTEWTRG